MTAVNPTIRPERPADVAAIDRLTRAAFGSQPHGSSNEHHIIQALRASGQLTISLVAEVDGDVVGHIAISPVSIADGANGWFGLGPMAVTPQYQGKGIGQRLAREALQALRALGAAGCVVVGEPAFYGKFGFKHAAALVFEGLPPHYFQALHFGESRPQGSVAYPEAFSARAG